LKKPLISFFPFRGSLSQNFSFGNAALDLAGKSGLQAAFSKAFPIRPLVCANRVLEKARGTGLCFILPLLISLGACAALSPVSLSPERGLPAAPAPENVQPRWLPFAGDLVRGLDYYGGKIRKPRLEFRALRVDLSEPALQIVINGSQEERPGFEPGKSPVPEGGVKGAILSTWVSGFVRRYGLLAGINASPFDPVSGKEGEPRTIAGVLIREGVLVSPPVSRYEALVFYTGGGAAILNQGELGDLKKIHHALGGFHRLLEKNQLSERARGSAKNPSSPRHSRSAAGLSAEGKYLYLLVIDGRRAGSIGATEAETAIILRQLGAAGGINLDGGGSSSLALRFPDGTVRPVNIPVHGGLPGRERGVASCLGIGLRETAAGTAAD
jgi:hypothetical protein